MTTAHVTAILLDGSKHEATGAFRALADKVAWERRFKVSFVSFQKTIGDAVADGKMASDANVDDLTTEREAFLPWRLLNREKAFTGDFDSFVENVESLEIEVFENEAGAGVDPTSAPIPSTTDSPPSP